MSLRLRRLLPGPVRRLARMARERMEMHRAISALLRVPLGEVPPPAVLKELARCWGNPLYAADPAYTEVVCRWALVTQGPVLECGSGLTTLLLAALAARRGVEVWSLEHHPDWHQRASACVRRIGHARVALAPLRFYEDFEWYDPPTGLPKHFRLIICDGPPGATPGGRYGLLPIMRNCLADGAVILLDDAQRAGERDVIHRWQQAGWDLLHFGTYAELMVRHA